jgi:site-specific DNA recombinase
MRVKDEHPAKGLAAGYGRVSLATPHLNQDSPENHVRVNRQTAARSGLKIKPGYEFYDRGISGSKDVRLPELERAIRAVVEREVEALIVPALDRLSRRGIRHVGEMLDAVEAAGGRIIFGREGLDSGSPGSRAIIVFLAEQARAEAQVLSWRLATWQEGCRLMGKWTGKRPYGYLIVDGRLVHHPEEAPIVRRIVAAYLSGQGCRQIAMTLNDEGVLSPNTAKAEDIRARGGQPKNQPTSWGLSTVSELLRNPVLVGWRQHRGAVVLGPDGQPVSFGAGILQPAERTRIIAERDRRMIIVKKSPLTKWIGRTTDGSRPPRYLLAGLATCETCGYSMVGHNRPERGHVVYRCSTFINGYTCKTRAHIQSDVADEEVHRQLTVRLSAIKPADPIVDAIAKRWSRLATTADEGERSAIQSRRAAVRDQIAHLEQARYVRGEFRKSDEVARWEQMLGSLKAQCTAIEDALHALGPPPDFEIGGFVDTYLSSDTWDAIPLAQRRELLQATTDRIIIVPAHRQRSLPAFERVRILLAGENADAQAIGAEQRTLGRWARASTSITWFDHP